jgi:hypothetical protein
MKFKDCIKESDMTADIGVQAPNAYSNQIKALNTKKQNLMNQKNGLDMSNPGDAARIKQIDASVELVDQQIKNANNLLNKSKKVKHSTQAGGF